MRELLERCAATVQARVGAEALVYVKRLRVRWQLDEQRIGEASLPSTLGEELGELLLAQLDALTPRQRLRPRADAELALFRGAGHLHAAHVADRAAGGDGAAWF